jgi:nicotinamidase-related amidase
MLDTKTCALLAMDFEPDIVSLAAAGGSEKAVRRVRVAIDAARRKAIRVIFVRVAYRAGYPDASERNLRVSMLKQKGLLAESGPGSQLVAELGARPEDPVVVKRRVSALAHTDLQTLLSTLGIDTLVLAGLTTSGVVLSTVRQAADADYRLIVLEDGCADADPQVHQMLVTKIFPLQATVATVDEFLTLIGDR